MLTAVVHLAEQSEQMEDNSSREKLSAQAKQGSYNTLNKILTLN